MDFVQGRAFVNRRLRVTLGVAAPLAVLMTALVLPATASADAAVEITEGSPSEITTWGFTPPEVTVAAGQQVTWTNTGSAGHTATDPDGAFDTGLIAPGESKTVTVSSTGTFGYMCMVHPWMRGILTVTAAGAETAVPPLAQPTVAPRPATATPAPEPTQATAAPVAQSPPTPTVLQIVTPTPLRIAPTTTAPPPAGGVPLEVAVTLLAAGAGALSGGLYVLRGSRRRE